MRLVGTAAREHWAVAVDSCGSAQIGRPDRDRRGGALDARLWSVLERLEEVRSVHGHLEVPLDPVCGDGFRLGKWLARRRAEAQSEKLRPCYRVLDDVRGWDWEPCNPRLIIGLERLCEYVAEYGTSRVPLWYECDDGFRLGVWVRSRRARPSSCAWLNEVLEQMPFWRVSRKGVPPRTLSDRVIDEELLRRIATFRAKYGSVPVPPKYRCEDGFWLGQRLQTCLARDAGRHEILRNALRREPWPIRTSETFRNEALSHLWGYVREHGSASPSASYVCDDDFRLGAWVHRRRRRRGADLDLDAQLESLPGWTWSPLESRFRERVLEVQEAALAGRLRGDRRLSGWLGEQRRAARADRLDPAYVDLLRQSGLIDVQVHRG